MPEILALCGKGGVGKTAISALLGRAILDGQGGPVLFVDADPVGGLTLAIGETSVRNLADVRREVLAAARAAQDEGDLVRLADEVDYLLQAALLERDEYAVLSMGKREGRGCNCRVNALLRDAIDLAASPFAVVLIDAEAGIEQINRQVTRRVQRLVAITDGSVRGANTISLIAELFGPEKMFALGNRTDDLGVLPEGVASLGCFPEDELLRSFDRTGRTLWDLPIESPARIAAAQLARDLQLVESGLVGGST